jgi:hypothetical protein
MQELLAAAADEKHFSPHCAPFLREAKPLAHCRHLQPLVLEKRHAEGASEQLATGQLR